MLEVSVVTRYFISGFRSRWREVDMQDSVFTDGQVEKAEEDGEQLLPLEVSAYSVSLCFGETIKVQGTNNDGLSPISAPI